MRSTTNLKSAATCVAVLFAACFATGCVFNPVNFISRNACEFVNCDKLFFIEELLPLSARQGGDIGSGGEMIMNMEEAEEEGGGHAH